MDLDAELKKIKNFMNDVHTQFPGGADGLKAAAAAARDGEPMSDSIGTMGGAPAWFQGDVVERVMRLGARLESLLPEIEEAIGTAKNLVEEVATLAEAVAALQQAQGAPVSVTGAPGPQSGSGTATASSGGP
jgi:hypothetical protein